MPTWLNRSTVLWSLLVLFLGTLAAVGVVYFLFPAEPAPVVVAPAEPDPMLYIVITGSGRVTTYPAGIDCASQCQASFPKDSIIGLTATPDAGYQLDTATSDCVSGSIKLERSSTCTVRFAVIPPPAEPTAEPAPKLPKKKSTPPNPAPTTSVSVASSLGTAGPGAPAHVIAPPAYRVVVVPAPQNPRCQPVVHRSLYAYNFVHNEVKGSSMCGTRKKTQSGYASLNPRR